MTTAGAGPTHVLVSQRWGLLAVVAAFSLVTMPVTAIWFLLLGPLALVVAAVAATFARSRPRKAELLTTGASVGGGLLVGPVVYLALAIGT